MRQRAHLYRACHRVSGGLKRNARRFRLVIDTMIDIVEKIEASVSFEDMQQIRSRMEEEKKLRAEQLRLNPVIYLHLTIMGLLDKRQGLMAKEIGDELRSMGLAIENIEVIHALSKLMKEGKVTRVQGSDRIRYLRAL